MSSGSARSLHAFRGLDRCIVKHIVDLLPVIKEPTDFFGNLCIPSSLAAAAFGQPFSILVRLLDYLVNMSGGLSDVSRTGLTNCPSFLCLENLAPRCSFDEQAEQASSRVSLSLLNKQLLSLSSGVNQLLFVRVVFHCTLILFADPLPAFPKELPSRDEVLLVSSSCSDVTIIGILVE